MASAAFMWDAKTSGEHQAEHAEVADERPEGMAERGRLVLLQNEVAGPGEPVTDGKEQQGVPRMSENQRAQNHDATPSVVPMACKIRLRGSLCCCR